MRKEYTPCHHHVVILQAPGNTFHKQCLLISNIIENLIVCKIIKCFKNSLGCGTLRKGAIRKVLYFIAVSEQKLLNSNTEKIIATLLQIA